MRLFYLHKRPFRLHKFSTFEKYPVEKEMEKNMSSFAKIKRYGWVAALIVAIFLVLPLATGRGGKQGAVEETATVVDVNFDETVDVIGEFRAEPFANLAWKTSGVVEVVYVEQGE